MAQNGSNGSNGSRDISGRFSRNDDHRNSWFGRSQDDEEEHRRYEEERRRYEEARRRYDEAHERYFAHRRHRDQQADRGYRDEYRWPDNRHRFADTDDEPQNNWRGWSGRAFAYDEQHRDPNVPNRDRIAHDEHSRYAPRHDEQYGHPSVRGRLDYDQQWASRTERSDDNRASRIRGRDEDQDRDFVPRDEYGRRRR